MPTVVTREEIEKSKERVINAPYQFYKVWIRSPLVVAPDGDDRNMVVIGLTMRPAPADAIGRIIAKFFGVESVKILWIADDGGAYCNLAVTGHQGITLSDGYVTEDGQTSVLPETFACDARARKH